MRAEPPRRFAPFVAVAALLAVTSLGCGGSTQLATPAPAPVVTSAEPSGDALQRDVATSEPTSAEPSSDASQQEVATPPRPLFEGQESITYAAFIEEMRQVADELTTSPEVASGYEGLLADYQLTPEDISVTSYSRVRLAFEAARDGGLWGVRWTITDQMPWSDEIWQQWAAREWSGDPPETTAQAECDELSALFSFLARDLGVQGFVGLFWPAWNHTVAVWEVTRRTGASPKGEPVRILVPTSQIWLSREATLGTREMKTNRVVFPYPRVDLKPDELIPAPVARYLIGQLRTYGAWSSERLLERRSRLGGS